MNEEAHPVPHKIGRYEIKGELGRGGMATVYRAHDPHFKRDVALKLLPVQLGLDPMFRQRFKREAETVAALEHPAIVPVYDFGEENGQLFLVMRLMTGGSLADKLANGRMPMADVVRVTERIASALDRAHLLGIIHRDLKPGNILFDNYGDAYLADFGIARLAESSATLTGSGVIGTPAYMSPEQIEGKSVDGRTDIYALGIIIFEMLTGKKPYEADTPAMILVKQMTEPVPHILDFDPDLPPNCELTISRAMAKNAEQRFRSASEVTATLKGLSPAEPLMTEAAYEAATHPTPTIEPTAVAEPPPPPTPESVAEPDETSGRPRWHFILVGVVGFLCLLCVMAALASQNRRNNTAVTNNVPSASDAEQNQPEPSGRPSDFQPVQQMGRGTVDTIRLSPDQETLAVAGSLGVWLYDKDTAEPFNLLQGHTDHVRDVAWSPDGEFLASASWDSTIQLWDIDAGESVAVLDGPDQYLTVDWSPDGDWLAAGTWLDFVEIWDIDTQQIIHEISGLEDSTTQVAWSPDGDWLAAGSSNGRVLIWAREQEEIVQTWEAHAGELGCLTWSPTDSALLTCGLEDSVVRIWRERDGELIPPLEIPAHEYGVYTAVWSVDGGRITTSGGDGMQRTWDAATGELINETQPYVHSYFAMEPTFYEDGREQLIAAAVDSALVVTDFEGVETTAVSHEHTNRMWGLDWSNSNLLSALSDGALVSVWNPENGDIVQQIMSEREAWEAFAAAWSPDGTVLATTWDNNTVQYWQTDGWTTETDELGSSMVALAWAPDGQHLAFADVDSVIYVWDYRAASPIASWPAHDGRITSLDWSPDSARLASSGEEGLAHVWNREGNHLATLEGHTDVVTAVVWSPDGTRLASSSFDQTARLWNAETGEQEETFTGHTELVTDIDWAPDGQRLASTGWDYVVRVWAASNGREEARLEGHVGPVLSVVWSPDGRQLASSSMDGTIILWEDTE